MQAVDFFNIAVQLSFCIYYTTYIHITHNYQNIFAVTLIMTMNLLSLSKIKAIGAIIINDL